MVLVMSKPKNSRFEVIKRDIPLAGLMQIVRDNDGVLGTHKLLLPEGASPSTIYQPLLVV